VPGDHLGIAFSFTIEEGKLNTDEPQAINRVRKPGGETSPGRLGTKTIFHVDNSISRRWIEAINGPPMYRANAIA
jgi:hypothetical protein